MAVGAESCGGRLMGSERTANLPAGLEGVRRRLERWRGRRKARPRIAEPLWTAAVKMAETHGIHRTAKTLRLDYYSLKKRFERKAAGGDDVPDKRVAATFLELPAAAWAGSGLSFGECTLELENTGGAKMRVHLKGVAAPDLTALGRSFWQSES